MSLTTLSDAVANPGRAFVKQPWEKDFEAGVYTGDKLPAMSTDVPVLVSEIVTFTREYRLLALDDRVHTGSRYLTDAYRRRGRLRVTGGSLTRRCQRSPTPRGANPL